MQDDRIGSRDEELDHLYAEVERLKRLCAAWKQCAKDWRNAAAVLMDDPDPRAKGRAA